MVDIDEKKYPRLSERLRKSVRDGKMAQLHEFATDLAIGFEEGIWGSKVMVSRNIGGVTWGFTERAEMYHEFFKALRSKWSEDNQPDFYAMYSYGYLIPEGDNAYILSEKALQLVDTPAILQQVFISYKRKESSAFALLLEKSIRYETNATPFLDMSIDPGEEWHAKLEERVRDSDVFVAVLAPESLDSPYVRKEIEWALSNEKTDLIPVWHAEYQGKHADDPLNGHQAVVVDRESAKHYRSAVDEVMNRLGYSVAFLDRRRAGAGVQA